MKDSKYKLKVVKIVVEVLDLIELKTIILTLNQFDNDKYQYRAFNMIVNVDFPDSIGSNNVSSIIDILDTFNSDFHRHESLKK